MESLALSPGLEREWAGFLLSMPRFVAMSALLPFFRAPQVPGAIRNCFMAMIALLLAPAIANDLSANPPEAIPAGMLLLALLIKESLIGLLMGFFLSLTFSIAESAGDFIDNQRGASIASLFNPAAGTQASPLGLFLSQAFIAWFILAGGLLLLFEFFFASFRAYPATHALPVFGPHALAAMLDMFAAFIKLALLVAAPIVFSMLIAELGLGLVSRFAPQLNVFFISMPLKSLVAIFLLLVYLRTLLPLVMEHGLFFQPGELFLALLAAGR